MNLSGIAQTIFREGGILPRTQQKLVIEIQKYINRNISDNVSLTALSNKFCYNCLIFPGFIKNEAYRNISTEYVLRMLKAAENQELKISVITDLIGFKTPSYFTRFSKSYGIHVQEYRNMINV